MTLTLHFHPTTRTTLRISNLTSICCCSFSLDVTSDSFIYAIFFPYLFICLANNINKNAYCSFLLYNIFFMT